MKKIYVGAALNYSPEEFRAGIERFKDSLRKKYEVFDFVGLTAGTAKDVYEWDTKCVRTCDLLVADCSYPGIGLGFELGLAVEIGKPVLAIAHKDANVTRMVLGIESPHFTFRRYDTIQDAGQYVDELLAEK